MRTYNLRDIGCPSYGGGIFRCAIRLEDSAPPQKKNNTFGHAVRSGAARRLHESRNSRPGPSRTRGVRHWSTCYRLANGFMRRAAARRWRCRPIFHISSLLYCTSRLLYIA